MAAAMMAAATASYSRQAARVTPPRRQGSDYRAGPAARPVLAGRRAIGGARVSSSAGGRSGGLGWTWVSGSAGGWSPGIG